MICKNCKQNFEGNFCNNCGQSSKVRKVDFKYLLDEFSNSVFQVNRGILFTVKELFTRPGHSIREFLSGKRKQHFKPLAYILLLSSIYVLITFLIGKKTYLGDALSKMTRAINDNGIELSMTGNFLNWLSNNFAYSTLTLLPIFSLASYISFIKAKYNYFEHLILNFYVAGQQIIIYLIFALLFFLFKIENYFIQSIPYIFALLFTFWTFIQFFKSKKTYLKILLIILTYALNFILIMIAITLIRIIEMGIKR